MNEKQIETIFKAARREPAPVPTAGFERRVIRAVADETPQATLLEQLSSLLPRLAASAALVIALCVAVDVCLSKFVQDDLDSGLTQLAQQWLFAAK